MSLPETYVEILQESRAIFVDRTSTKQTIVIHFKLPVDEFGDTIPPVAPNAEFLGDDEDIVALETIYELMPVYRYIPNSDGDENVCVLIDITLKEKDNFGWWTAEATYKYDDNTGTGGMLAQPEDLTLPFIKIGFSAGTGESRKVTQSLSCTGSARADLGPARPVPPNGYNAIGATDDNIEGADIPGGGLELNITAYYFPSSLTFSFLQILRDLMDQCSTNNAVFLGFEIGEVLLHNITGEVTVVDVIPITFSVTVKKNKEAVADPPFGALTMTGHQILDYRYVKVFEDDSETFLQLPEFRFIHTVFPSMDFGDLGFPVS